MAAITLDSRSDKSSYYIKVVAYQTETDLVALVAPHYARVEDEGCTLIPSALAAPANIHATDHELRVTLARLSSPHGSCAIAAPCDHFTAANSVFPATRLARRIAVTPPP